MSERLHYTHVRPIADRINQTLGLSKSGAPLSGRGKWIEGCYTLENCGYGTWSVCVVTNKRGAVASKYRGKLRDCKSYLEGMADALTLSKGKN